jgi:hypothetical protein
MQQQFILYRAHLPFIEKVLYIPNRYSANSILENDQGKEMINFGLFFIPFEYEITGNFEHSTNNEGLNHKQYPMFKNINMRKLNSFRFESNNFVKRNSSCTTAFVSKDSNKKIIGVNSSGELIDIDISNISDYTINFPFCFRLAKDPITIWYDL